MNGIIVVVSAGQTDPNNPKAPNTIMDYDPQRLGSITNADTPLIVVGGITENGGVLNNQYQDNGHCISVYARADVTCAYADPQLATKDFPDLGTSFAAPAVAGVIASWLATDFVVALIRKEKTNASSKTEFAAQVRQFLIGQAWQRHGSPAGVETVYNGAVRQLCALESGEDEEAIKRAANMSLPRKRSSPNIITVAIDGTLVDPTFAVVSDLSCSGCSSNTCTPTG